MIVDCHTQAWASEEQLGQIGPQVAAWMRLQPDAARSFERERHPVAEPVDRAIVLGFRSRYLGVDIPNEFIAQYVGRHSEQLIGFAGIDPTESDAVDQLQRAREELGLVGLVISPGAQDFHPMDTAAMQIYELAQRWSMPMLVIHSEPFTHGSKAVYAQPMLWDEVCTEFPDMKVILGSMALPSVRETAWLVGKHENLFADISGLFNHPWMMYTALVWAQELGAIDKLLFGSGFPFRIASDGIEALYRLHQMVAGSNFPAVPRQKLQSIVERDTLRLLGLGGAEETNSDSATGSLIGDNET